MLKSRTTVCKNQSKNTVQTHCVSLNGMCVISGSSLHTTIEQLHGLAFVAVLYEDAAVWLGLGDSAAEVYISRPFGSPWALEYRGTQQKAFS